MNMSTANLDSLNKKALIAFAAGIVVTFILVAAYISFSGDAQENYTDMMMDEQFSSEYNLYEDYYESNSLGASASMLGCAVAGIVSAVGAVMWVASVVLKAAVLDSAAISNQGGHPDQLQQPNQPAGQQVANAPYQKNQNAGQ